MIAKNLFTLKEASLYASQLLEKNVSVSNISYLVNYGKIRKENIKGNLFISKQDLDAYYDSLRLSKEILWKNKLGQDLNWALSFQNIKEKETTKHVHRLHPYKGKFIPQLVEYFLDSHVDKFKQQVYFNKGDIVLDPFCGSGTTLAVCSELGINAIGIDVSEFNALISNAKVANYDILKLQKYVNKITAKLLSFVKDCNISSFETELAQKLNKLNATYFPVPEFRVKVNQGLINEEKYGKEKALSFQPIYTSLIKKYNIILNKPTSSKFLEKWFLGQTLEEAFLIKEEIERIPEKEIQNVLKIILSRVMRSCRATTHSDLATIKEPVTSPYYCRKHGRICKPLFSITKWWLKYTEDTICRLKEFSSLKTPTYQTCLIGDSRNIHIKSELKNFKELSKLMIKNGIKGIFTSPPYVGLIDYHEQHAYAYELFNFIRRDDHEIGPLFKGKGSEAKRSYVEGISSVLVNCKRYLAKDFNIFIVANDKYNLYPTIAEKASLSIVNTYKRPVLNRTEKDKGAYSETIFHLKEKKS